jgi:hypothetical protein
MRRFPFDATMEEISENPGPYIDAVFESLESEFLIMPKGTGFVEYSVFEAGYEALKRHTRGFSVLRSDVLVKAVAQTPIALVVLRCMMGFSPPEWAYLAARRSGITVTQGFVRGLDRKVRMRPDTALQLKGDSFTRVMALLETAAAILRDGPPPVSEGYLHRLDKADSFYGAESIRTMAEIGAPYAMLLYERFLGRPFAGHRDSVSELIGDTLETAIEDILSKAGISYRKTKRAERVHGFDQAPDFIVPSEFTPRVVIEAKITEDDGTARDKVTRIQHLAELSLRAGSEGIPKFEVVACIGGRGFGVRREDMRKMLLSTRGKVFTAQTLGRLVDSSLLKLFKAK